MSTIQESIVSDYEYDNGVLCDDRILSLTIIDIVEEIVDEHVHYNGDDESEVGDEEKDCENFFSKLLDFTCFPCNQQLHVEKPLHKTTEESDMTIECILNPALDKEEPDRGYAHAPICNASHESRQQASKDIVVLPPLSEWMQEPLLLIATPGHCMQIHRVRQFSELSYFDSPPLSRQQHGKAIQQLPINNGKEDPSDSWVIDFESNLFAGTALFRIKGSKRYGVPEKSDKKSDYFAKQNRKFQMCIRGKFKSKVRHADCASGLLLDRHLQTFKPALNYIDGCPCASESESSASNICVDASNKSKRLRISKRNSSSSSPIPPKWALRAAVKVAGVFSPRMDADLECSRPRILSPLCSTAQTINVNRRTSGNGVSRHLGLKHVEPCPHSDASLVSELKQWSTKKIDSTSIERKAICNAVYDERVESLAKCSAQDHASPCFDLDAEYTFEFLQHLVDYNDLSLDLGKLLGKVRLGGALRGQPVRFIACTQPNNTEKNQAPHLNVLWSFDLWHKSLLPD
jgi:hypothetical protein